MAVSVYTKTGTKSTSKVSLPKDVFGVKDISNELLRETYLAQTGNSRIGVAATRTRGNVRGGGRKPWRQKGTGRARAGSIRSPLWKGGGIVFGPSPQRKFSRNLNSRTRNKALAQALSAAVTSNRISVIDDLAASGKTKDVTKVLAKIGMERGLVVVDAITPEMRRSFSNINEIALSHAKALSAADVLNAYHLLISKAAVDMISSRLGDKS